MGRSGPSRAWAVCAVLAAGLAVPRAAARQGPVLPEFSFRSSSCFQRGHRLGRIAREDVAGFASGFRAMAEARTFASLPAGAPIVRKMMRRHRKRYPCAWRELKGIAAGANATFADVFLLSVHNELAAALRRARGTERAEPVAGCTDVLFWSPERAGLVHNEDSPPALLGRALLFNDSRPDGSWVWALSNPGYPPGLAFGATSRGLVLSVNAIYTREPDLRGFGKYWIARDVLHAASLADAVRRAVEPRPAFGLSLNIVSAQAAGPGAASVELVPGGAPRVRVVGASPPLPPVAGWEWHANEYRRAPARTAQGEESSVSRGRRIAAAAGADGDAGPEPRGAARPTAHPACGGAAHCTVRREARRLALVGARGPGGASFAEAVASRVLGDAAGSLPLLRSGAPPDTLATAATFAFDACTGRAAVQAFAVDGARGVHAAEAPLRRQIAPPVRCAPAPPA